MVSRSELQRRVSSSRWRGGNAVSLLAVWGALEHLFSPAKQELRFRVTTNIAAYLESPGPTRMAPHQRLMSL